MVIHPALASLRAVCPRCRRLVRPGTCELDHTQALEPAVAAERERMVELTWGMPDHRQALRKSASQRLGARRMFTGAVTFASATGAVYIGTADGLLSLVSGVFMGMFGAALATGRAQVVIPGPALDIPRWPHVGTGRIVHGEPLASPGSGTPCAAWAIELRYDGPWGSRTVFRAGATLGVDIVLDSGGHVRIPGGALWLDGKFNQLDGEEASVQELLREIDPDAASSDWELFPFNIITEQLVDEGDRVEVLGVVEPRPTQTDDVPLYRDAPASELVHIGLPVMRRV
ncbi:MAG: hypothetical protein M4D80_31980 [Myxococcota bacterium]|nr:hypothetical protein [Myxococcota bacterium]